MVIDAMRLFQHAFQSLENEMGPVQEAPGALQDDAESALSETDLKLRLYYQNEFLPRLNKNLGKEAVLADYWPKNEITRALQYLYIAAKSLGSPWGGHPRTSPLCRLRYYFFNN